MRLFPRLEAGQLFGEDLTGTRECRGISLSFQWLGLIVDLNIGKLGPLKERAK